MSRPSTLARSAQSLILLLVAGLDDRIGFGAGEVQIVHKFLGGRRIHVHGHAEIGGQVGDDELEIVVAAEGAAAAHGIDGVLPHVAGAGLADHDIGAVTSAAGVLKNAPYRGLPENSGHASGRGKGKGLTPAQANSSWFHNKPEPAPGSISVGQVSRPAADLVRPIQSEAKAPRRSGDLPTYRRYSSIRGSAERTSATFRNPARSSFWRASDDG